MPIWCENTLSVMGPAEELKLFREFANPLSAELFLPIPEELKDINYSGPAGSIEDIKDYLCESLNTDDADIWQYPRWRTEMGQDIPISDEEQNALFKKYRARDVCEWVWKNWELGGDFCECKVEDHGGMIVYRFDTASAPALLLFEIICEAYPNLLFECLFQLKKATDSALN